jgi:hypothetical protein
MSEPRWLQETAQRMIRDRDEARRERDEARAAVTTANSVVAEWQRDMEKAEARGFERGVREAAVVCDRCPDSHWCPWIRKRILALLEKPNS